jgi:hypothetical protein
MDDCLDGSDPSNMSMEDVERGETPARGPLKNIVSSCE